MNSHTPSNDNSVGTPVIAAVIDPLEDPHRMSAPAGLSTGHAARSTGASRPKVRYAILLMLFLVTAINVGDRGTPSITARRSPRSCISVR